jgi:RNA polymerase sigma-70 factor (ECF subfamily)
VVPNQPYARAARFGSAARALEAEKTDVSRTSSSLPLVSVIEPPPASGFRRAARLEPGEEVESDAALALAVRNQDLAAAGRLYDRYARNVRAMVLRLLGPDTEADDVVQEVFVAAITSIHRLREPAALRSWLLGIAVGKVRDNLRSRWRRRWLSFHPTDELPERPVPSTEAHADVAQEVSALLDQLPPEERIALILHRLEGMSLEEASTTTGMSVSTFKRRLARAEAKFMLRAGRRPALSDWLGLRRS